MLDKSCVRNAIPVALTLGWRRLTCFGVYLRSYSFHVRPRSYC